ncbi:bifunctional proline dehydrogenase/L-glutamate gamma-semialdehyde dehydrogenase PutA [Chitinibacter sp. GC72]|uniref:bifunctional proline dehydrogenase/L-glutamate gamma-semialdehyde dehydrogenase PutA n=1 Tax=Chitinibacter sp. GC72 TaxID=1526917 RepID=UPI0012FBA3B4|nr:bifunctional proline dehydrogenase/L-glutamate gamma-semialdehyde dehydrogenase PutA [Chitinibacter sp. GC72]
MIRAQPAFPALPTMFAPLAQAQLADELSLARQIRGAVHLVAEQSLRADALAHLLKQKLQFARQAQGSVDNLLTQYPLSSPAGQALLNLAEGVLRIGDQQQLDRFIETQLHSAQWHAYRGVSPSWAINLATLGLDVAEHLPQPLATPVIREGMKKAMHMLASQLIIARDIESALKQQDPDFLYAFALSGEPAIGREDAAYCFEQYEIAIHLIGRTHQGGTRLSPSVSVKLSTLYEQFTLLHYQQVQEVLYPRLLQLALLAKHYDIGLMIEAEESSRQLLTLQLLSRLLQADHLAHWDGLGITVQACQKNALHTVKWLNQYTKQTQRQIQVRLVKGTFWEREIRQAQQAALGHYPVWTQAEHTEQCYLACAQALLQSGGRIHPQFATHNPFTLSYLHQMAGSHDFEFQALFGLGETLYQLAKELGIDRPCRLYAPVGAHHDLLPYLVRRYLQHHANPDTVQQLPGSTEAGELLAKGERHFPAPCKIFSPRETPALDDPLFWPQGLAWYSLLNSNHSEGYIARPIMEKEPESNTAPRICYKPADTRQVIGHCYDAPFAAIEPAFASAQAQLASWHARSIKERTRLINAVSNQLLQRQAALIYLLVSECGYTLLQARNELRQAIDLCRYHAQQARSAWPETAPAPLGIVIVIGDRHSPLAMWIAPIVAALLIGNTVIAKPAPEACLIATQAIRCFHQAGIPEAALQMLPGGAALGAALTLDQRCQGVCFQGTQASAHKVRQTLAEFGAGRVLLAHPHSLNVMVADSSATLPLLIRDVRDSAWPNAGQHPEALRLLCVQQEIAEQLILQLKQAMDSLVVGDPAHAASDLGPMLNPAALAALEQEISQRRAQGCQIFQPQLSTSAADGQFMAPTLIEIDDPATLKPAPPGPILYVWAYHADQQHELGHLINARANCTTLGIHSRISQHIEQLIAQTRAGNYRINRNLADAIVGSHPLGKLASPWTLWQFTRHASPCQPHYRELASNVEELRKIAQLWPDIDQGLDLEILFEDAARRSPLQQALALPGILGEYNELRYRPLGRIACLGPSEWDLVQQIGMVLLTGNQAVLSSHHQRNSALRSFQLEHIIWSDDPLQESISAAMCHPNIADACEKRLAQHSLAPLILPYEDGRWPLQQLVQEYSISGTDAVATVQMRPVI